MLTTPCEFKLYDHYWWAVWGLFFKGKNFALSEYVYFYTFHSYLRGGLIHPWSHLPASPQKFPALIPSHPCMHGSRPCRSWVSAEGGLPFSVTLGPQERIRATPMPCCSWGRHVVTPVPKIQETHRSLWGEHTGVRRRKGGKEHGESSKITISSVSQTALFRDFIKTMLEKIF